ncbi:MAG: tetratricopeptide repeat protein [Pirellulales bacterium]
MACLGCRQQAAPTPGGAASGGSIKADRAAIEDMQPISAYHVGEPLTEEECQGWGNQLVRGMAAHEDALLASLIDWRSMLDRATSGIDVPQNMRTGFSQGAVQGITKSVLGDVQNAIDQGYPYRMIRVLRIDGQHRVLMRLMPGTGGAAYHDFTLARRADGVVRAVDMYLYINGESVSESVRRMYLMFVMDKNKGFLDRLRGTKNPLVEHIQDIAKIAELVRGGQGAEALRLSEKLPRELHRERSVIVLRHAAAQAVGEAEYAATMADLEQLVPDDGSMDLMMIDAYFLKQDYKRAMRCLNCFDKAIGGDSYMDALRANLYSSEGQLEKARRAISRAIEQESDIISYHWILITIQLQESDFEGVLESLKFIDSNFAVELEDLTTVPEYAEFVKSPQYQSWLESR